MDGNECDLRLWGDGCVARKKRLYLCEFANATNKADSMEDVEFIRVLGATSYPWILQTKR